MRVPPFQLTVCFAFCCAMFGFALASQTAPANHIGRRIYVEPFVTRAGSEKFREDVIAELRKVKSVSLADGESSADAILGGGGEVWIKGYRSHNPQLGNVPPNGTPIYTGFLSIELRDKSGQTLWSYLATPPAASAPMCCAPLNSENSPPRSCKYAPDFAPCSPRHRRRTSSNSSPCIPGCPCRGCRSKPSTAPLHLSDSRSHSTTAP